MSFLEKMDFDVNCSKLNATETLLYIWRRGVFLMGKNNR